MHSITLVRGQKEILSHVKNEVITEKKQQIFFRLAENNDEVSVNKILYLI
ncbi:hypothetical protein EMIT091MI3_40084 [Kosakonia quasisacchari]